MVNITNVAKEWLGDTVHIVLPTTFDFKDEWELDLQLKEGDKIDLLDIISKLEKADDIKPLLEKQEGVIKEIIRRSYTSILTDDQINNLCMKRSAEILLELSFKFGIRDREAYEALLERKQQEIKNIREGVQPIKESQ